MNVAYDDGAERDWDLETPLAVAGSTAVPARMASHT